MPRDCRFFAKSSSYMRRTALLGVAPTTATFLKPRFAAAGSAHWDVSWVVAAHDASATSERAARVSRVVVLSFMESVPPLPGQPDGRMRMPGPEPGGAEKRDAC